MLARPPDPLSRDSVIASEVSQSPDSEVGYPAARDARPRSDSTQAVRDHAVLAACFDPIVTVDVRGIIQSASDSVLRLIGWSPGELVGRNINMLLPEPHHSVHDECFADYHRTGRTCVLDRPRRCDVLRRDGSLVPVEVCISRAQAGGEPLFVCILRDMSGYAAAERTRDQERMQSERLLADQATALQTAHLRLRIADRMASMGALAAGLGHDMNNVLLPVRARLNALRAACEAGTLPANERKHIGEIRKSIAYLQQLADGLHILAMDPDADQDARADGAGTDLHHWWSQTGTLLVKAVPRHVRVSVSIPADLPLVAIAAHALTQAVLNLVVNAGEAIPGPPVIKRRQGHVRVWAELRQDSGGPWVRLGVTDNGTGMSQDVKRRAFEMFYTTKPRGLGTGLGLALVRRVVERAGGRVEVESEVNHGTSVVLIVPAVLATDRAGPATAGLSAVISLGDGRAASLVRHILEVAGTHVRPDRDPSRALIWVVDPAVTEPAKVSLWRTQCPRGRLVLFGRPDQALAGAWQALEPLMIEHPNDLTAIREVIDRAVHGSDQGAQP